ncbi:PIG-L deacetylase family protein [Microbacterium saperdae]|uniref:LmbE family N-acetylglucosaminyl deacetylase n=1 Tax=Microbacterium saperdae TaxID=69368 RepID=A0A543BIX9_9MICO|nr:PIG-L deacetylase family protein [Microbacterium saperdae]TQL84758.1 LmbE family N-acetylglucosaminyl deacetylase [Microbacterium saperdae]GGM64259.1 GlcNAc-PI de-N-acetylase [Microbacterium saperdae]
MTTPSRVLAIGAHPDDVDFLCGGTLALYAEGGAKITIAVATRGDIGAPSGTRDEIAHIRRGEAQASADVIGADLIWMGEDDEFLFSDRASRLAMIDVIRHARPDVMFILDEDDYNPDHRAAGTLARDSRVPATVPLIQTRNPALDRAPTTFVMDTYGSHRFEPEGYVDISPVMTVKERMLMQHASQVHWMGSVFGTDVLDPVRAQAGFRGAQAGTHDAEGFRLLRDYPHTGGWELLPRGRRRQVHG